MAKKPRKSSRAAQLARRKREQEKRKLTANRDRLFALSPGGSPDQPLSVSSSVIIESKAAATPCPQCAASLIVDEHEARQHQGQSLRLVTAHCRQCAAPRKIWFRIAAPVAN